MTIFAQISTPFHTEYKIEQPFSKNAPISFVPADSKQCLKDWRRLSTIIFINGKSVETLLKADHAADTTLPDNFDTIETLRAFWLKHLVRHGVANKEAATNEENRVLDFYECFLHQGAWLFPLMTALIEKLTLSSDEIANDIHKHTLRMSDFVLNGAAPDPDCMRLDFTTKLDSQSLAITESLRAKQISHSSNEPSLAIYPDYGSNYVFATQCTHTVSLTPSGLSTALSPIRVTYHSQKARELLDDRGLWTRILDRVKAMLGFMETVEETHHTAVSA
ncbi:MAG: hypothetical protein AB7F64_01080 [Gammaproteobacteria bacterium]